MSDTTTQLPVPPKQGRKTAWLIMAVVIIGAVLVVLHIPPKLVGEPPAADLTEKNEKLQAQVDTLTHRMTVLEGRVESMDAASPTVATIPVMEKPDNSAAAGLAHMQSEMASLSSAMTALQTEVKATDTVALEARSKATGFVETMVAFMQLRDIANSGRAFTHELAAMREAAKNDAAILAICARIEPHATEGVPTYAKLFDELRASEPAITTAMAKTEAQTWWQRIMAQLHSLVSVRPLNGDAPGNKLADLESSFDRNGAKAALETFKQLPPEAQTGLADWRKKLETHEQVLDDIMMIPSQLISQPAVKAP
jgi:hypothetical protein